MVRAPNLAVVDTRLWRWWHRGVGSIFQLLYLLVTLFPLHDDVSFWMTRNLDRGFSGAFGPVIGLLHARMRFCMIRTTEGEFGGP